jgi:hypothetical protein
MMKNTLVVALIAVSAAVWAPGPVPGVAAETGEPRTDPGAALEVLPPKEIKAIWHFPTPVAPRPPVCNATWIPVQYVQRDQEGNAHTWFVYTLYYVCY